jgi:regulator of protease activity HflC (stomatin/prohibitin superfamily)
METAIWILVLTAVAAVLALLWAFRRLFERITIYEFQRGLRYRKGKFDGVLEPGQYRLARRTTRVTTIDTRPRFISVPGQEVLSSDSVSVKVSLAVEFAIEDPAKAVHDAEDYYDALYLTLQVALREIIGQSEIDQLLEKRDEVGRRLLEAAGPAVQEFGLKLSSVDIKDIMFPGPLKKVFASVVEARKEGLASLERARGEQASLRNLANAARIMEGNPMLMHLRLLQEIGGASGNTIVLGLPGVATPIPLREGERTVPTHEIEPTDE